ncbi:hypothetical protein LINGRAHAP2_LOCUS10631 [Linum grandiflorum]
MGCNLHGPWVFDGYGFSRTRWQPLLFLIRFLIWIINVRLLFCSSRSFAVISGKSTFLTFTVKLIMLRIFLANLGHSFTYGMHIVDSLDRGLSHWLHYDLLGVSLFRLVKVSSII